MLTGTHSEHTESEFLALQAGANQAVHLLKALANPDRLMLMCQLSMGEYTVNQLEQLTHIRQPSLSQQLGVLRMENLVSTRKVGKHVHYRIDSQAALDVMRVLHGHYCGQGSTQSNRGMQS